MWFSQQDNLHKRVGDLRLTGARIFKPEPVAEGGPVVPPTYYSPSNDWGNNVWVRSYGERGFAKTGVNGHRGYRSTIWGVDFGIDKGWQIDSSNQLFTGVFAGYGSAKQNFRRSAGSTGRTQAVQGGIYATWLRDNGWYVDGIVKTGHFRNKFDARSKTLGSTTGKYNNWGIGASIELGKQFQFCQDWFVEPMLQISYARINGSHFMTKNAMILGVHQRATDVWQARFGTRLGRNIMTGQTGIFQPYVKAGVVDQFSNNGNVQINGVGWRPNMDGVRSEVGAGAIWQINDVNQLHLDYQADFGQKYTKPVGLNLGYRLQF